jgi:hypothetical protein
MNLFSFCCDQKAFLFHIEKWRWRCEIESESIAVLPVSIATNFLGFCFLFFPLSWVNQRCGNRCTTASSRVTSMENLFPSHSPFFTFSNCRNDLASFICRHVSTDAQSTSFHSLRGLEIFFHCFHFSNRPSADENTSYWRNDRVQTERATSTGRFRKPSNTRKRRQLRTGVDF